MNFQPRLWGYGSLVLLLSACSSTSVIPRASQPDATIDIYNKAGKLKHSGTAENTLVVENEADFFEDGKDQALIQLYVARPGFQPCFVSQEIAKGKVNTTPMLDLLKLDTKLTIETDPPGATVTFYENEANARAKRNPIQIEPFLPFCIVGDGPATSPPLKTTVVTDRTPENKDAVEAVSKALTPFKAEYTGQFARGLSSIGAIRVELEDNVPDVKEVSIKPGVANHYSIPLRLFSRTKLTVVSDVPDVRIDDVRDGGFGHLGVAPFSRSFMASEVNARPQSTKRAVGTDIGESRIFLKLRFSKPGYDAEDQLIEVPLGEETTIRAPMNAAVMQYSFQSDPPEANVYLKVKNKVVELDGLGNKVEKEISGLKFLGTTPLNYNVDPTSPLKSTDSILLRKSGYQDNEFEFFKGQTNYHSTLIPSNVRER